MSRSLGDAVAHKCGVSAEPEILEHTIEDVDDFILIATDGVWDVLDNNQAIQIVQVSHCMKLFMSPHVG